MRISGIYYFELTTFAKKNYNATKMPLLREKSDESLLARSALLCNWINHKRN